MADVLHGGRTLPAEMLDYPEAMGPLWDEWYDAGMPYPAPADLLARMAAIPGMDPEAIRKAMHDITTDPETLEFLAAAEAYKRRPR